MTTEESELSDGKLLAFAFCYLWSLGVNYLISS